MPNSIFVVSFSAFLLKSIVSGDAGKTKYSPQFHPTTYLAKAIAGTLSAFGKAEKFTWPDTKLLDLHDHNPSWKSGGLRLERLKLEMEAFRPKTLYRFVVSNFINMTITLSIKSVSRFYGF